MVKRIGRGVLLCLMMFTLSGNTVGAAVLNNSRTSPEQDSAKEMQEQAVLPGFEKIAESDGLILYLEKETLSVQIEEKNTGLVYSSFVESSEGLNDIWQKFIRSGITVEYMSKDNKLTRISSAESSVKKNVEKEDGGFRAGLTFQQGFSLEFIVTVEKDHITVEIPKESIQETGEDFKIENIYVLPFLGASTGTEVPGYLFVPDGCGALMRTDQKSAATSGLYSKRIYGPELGTADYNLLVNETDLNMAEQIYVPVYGSVLQTGKKGVAAVIEQGDVYSMLEASLSGKETPVNYITSKFMIREPYTKFLDKKGKTMVANQKEPNLTDIKEHFYFLTGDQADYMGIAEVYRTYLEERQMFKEQGEAGYKDIPLNLDILLAEKKGMLVGHTYEVMTTWQDTDEILTDLKENGVENITAMLRGYTKQGASMAAPLNAAFLSKTGSQNDWKKLMEKYDGQGIEIGFYADFSQANKGNKGFSQKRDVAQSINENLLETWRGYFLRPGYSVDKLKEESKELKQAGASFLAVDSAGSMLYSNWNKKEPTSREESKELMEQMEAEGMRTGFYSPNSYMWKLSSVIYDIPMSSSQYLIFTDTVPFLQIVLKGRIPYYAPSSNFNADGRMDLLSMVEYGAYPSYFITKEDSVNLLGTPSQWLYTSQYDSWREQILKEYKELNGVLKQVEGASIESRSVPAEGVVLVTYSNGMTIGVNYTGKNYQLEDISIEAENFCIYGN